MNLFRICISLLLIFFCYCTVSAQQIMLNDDALSKKYPFIHSILNRIAGDNKLNQVYQKLFAVQHTGEGVVTIVHIGDSHIQAGVLGGTMRNNLQAYFGNAGRGLVFPYQLARSNGPDDIICSSNISWNNNRLVHPEIAISTGITGFAITTASVNGAAINISLKDSGNTPNMFNRVKLFFDSSSAVPWVLHAGENNNDTIIESNASMYADVLLPNYTNSFSITSLPTDNTKTFYGASLENDTASGVLYHTIGVNGARYDQYNTTPLFWQQLGALHADMYIISLGTNEAQTKQFDAAAFTEQVTLLLQHLQQVSPNAAVLITTPPDSYKRGRINAIVRSVSTAINNYNYQNAVPLWDLYRVTNGYGSAQQWKRYGMLRPDGVHFTAAGYNVQGTLLYNAFMKGYIDFKKSIEE